MAEYFSFVARVNDPVNGEKIVVNAPIAPTYTSIPFTKKGYNTIDYYNSNFQDSFDMNYTVFVPSTSTNAFPIGYFPSQYVYDVNVDVYIYIDSDNYMLFGSDGFKSIYSGGVLVYKSGYSGRGTYFPTYGDSEGTNLINVQMSSGKYAFNSYPTNYSDFTQKFYGSAIEYDSDPYSGGGASGTGGGTGTFSGTGDSIEFPGLPTLSAVSTGFITLFNPSIAQMQSLSNYMWSDLFDLDTFKKIFADPMDCILGLSIVPVAVPNGGTAEVKVGNISTGVSMTVASTQYVEVDCGTLNVQEYWGSYLDYDPYTKAEIYLPYCGTHPIAVDDIMGKSVHVKYHVDILSGACVAYVKCGSSVLYSFIGQCTSSIPITGNDWTNVVNGAISIASAIGSMVATGGATAPLVMPGVASTAVNSLKPSVEKSGSMSGTGGMLAVQTPYLILTRPRQALPKNQNTYTGYPSFIKEKLSDLKGYTEVAEIRLSGVDATDAELDEIVGLLKGGVII